MPFTVRVSNFLMEPKHFRTLSLVVFAFLTITSLFTLVLYNLCPLAIHQTISLFYSKYCQPFWLSAWLFPNKTINLPLRLNMDTAGLNEFHQALCSRPYWQAKMKSFQVSKVSLLKRSDQDKKQVNVSWPSQKESSQHIGWWKRTERACTNLCLQSGFENRHDCY